MSTREELENAMEDLALRITEVVAERNRLQKLFALNYPPPQAMALCVTPGQRLGAATLWDWLREEVMRHEPD